MAWQRTKKVIHYLNAFKTRDGRQQVPHLALNSMGSRLESHPSNVNATGFYQTTTGNIGAMALDGLEVTESARAHNYILSWRCGKQINFGS